MYSSLTKKIKYKCHKALFFIRYLIKKDNLGVIFSALNARYENVGEITYYKNQALEGLYPFELPILNILGNLNYPQNGKALVFGCGAGREVFALSKYFIEVHGIDSSKPLLSEGKSILRNCPQFHNCTFFNSSEFSQNLAMESYDFIYLTPALLNHIPFVGRRQILNQCRTILKKGGFIIALNEIYHSSFKVLSSLWLGEKIHQIRSALHREKFIPLSTFRSEFGTNSENPPPIFFQFFPDLDSIKREFLNAGFSLHTQHNELLCFQKN